MAKSINGRSEMANGIITLAKGENRNVSPLHGTSPFVVNWQYQLRLPGEEHGFAGLAEIVYAVSGDGMSDFINSVTIKDEEGKGIQLAADPDGSRKTPAWSWLRMKILEEYARQGDSERRRESPEGRMPLFF